MKRSNLAGLAALAMLATTTAPAHPGITDHHDVMAAAHDLGHITAAHPALALAALILGLTLAGAVAYRVKSKSRNGVREKPDLPTTQNFRPL